MATKRHKENPKVQPRHNNHMKTTRVKAHTRQGRAVQSHDRNVKPGLREKLKTWRKDVSEIEEALSEAIIDIGGAAPRKETVPIWESLKTFPVDPKYLTEPNEWTPERQKPTDPKEGRKLWELVLDKLIKIPGSTLKLKANRTGYLEWRFEESSPSSLFHPERKRRKFIRTRGIQIGPGTDFTKYLNDSEYWKMDRTSIDLTGANIAGSMFAHCDVSRMNLTGANLTGCNLDACRKRMKIPNAVAVGARFSRGDWEEFDAKNSVLREANFDQATLNQGNFDGADLRNISVENTRFRGCSFVGANLTGIDFSKLDFEIRANMRNAILLADQFDKLSDRSRYGVEYDEIRFEDAMKDLGLSEKRFEFLVLSGTIPVYDNENKQRVRSNFDPATHHVPCWGLTSLKKLAPELLTTATEE